MKELTQNPDYPIFEKSVLENKKFCLSKIMKLLYFYRYRREPITKELAKEILWEISRRILTSKKFRKEKCDYFKAFFCNVAKSVINNRIKKDEEEKHRGHIQLPPGIEEDIVDEVRYFLEQQPDLVLSVEDQIIYQEMLEEVRVLLKNDEEASTVIEFMIDGYSTLDISDLMEKPVSDIENAKKRIKRVVNKVIPKRSKKSYKRDVLCQTTELKI